MNTDTLPEITYFKQRIAQLGIIEKQLVFKRTWYQDSDEIVDGKILTKQVEHVKEYNILEPDQEGNILIRYFNLMGQPYRWKSDDQRMSKDFFRTRWAQPKGDQKYHQDKGSPQFPFFPPGLIKKYQSAKFSVESGTPIDNSHDGKINVLFMVEGEFKALKGELAGIDIIGLPSIHGFYNGDIKGRLHEDIQELLITCGVDRVVFLTDADLIYLKWAEGKDLATRPESFYGAVKSFRESLQTLIDSDRAALQFVYLMYIHPKYMNDAKGLDDLFCKYPEKQVEIVEDLHALSGALKYFKCWLINDLNKDVIGRLRKELGLVDEQEFYKVYQDFIGAREFKFKRRRYIYNEEKKEVVFMRHEDADKFMRIGPDWVKTITKLNKYGEPEEEIVPWKISEITRDYKKYPDFLEQIAKFDDFCNEPAFGTAYQRVHHGCYNLCAPLTWSPKSGSIAVSMRFLKHIFQGNSLVNLDEDGKPVSELLTLGDSFAVALDWLSIVLQHPKQMLPVPILVSKDNNTGKSTFLKFLQLIFKSNMAVLNNELFKMRFNGHYITRYIIAIDEGFLDVDKKAEKERLKQLVTSDSAYLEHKGMNVRKINFYGKVIICSNDADKVMKIDEGESRWFVIKVPVVPDDQKDPDLEVKLKAEMEAFIHFLLNRQIFHPRKDRLWFKSEWFITEQMRTIIAETKNRIDKIFEEWIKDQFATYGLDQLEYSLKHMLEQLNDLKVSKYKIDSVDLKAFLKTKGMTEPGAPKMVKVPVGFRNDGSIVELGTPESTSSPEIDFRKFTARPYTFLKADWLPSEKSVIEKCNNTDQSIEKSRTLKSGENDDLPF